APASPEARSDKRGATERRRSPRAIRRSGPGSPAPGSSSTSVEDVTIPASSPAPRPGPAAPAGPNVGALRSAFDDPLAGSAGTDDDDQVEALDAAHELLARALTALDSTR